MSQVVTAMDLPDLLADPFDVALALDDMLADRRDELRSACLDFAADDLGAEAVALLRQGVAQVKAIDVEIANRAALAETARVEADALVASISPAGEPSPRKVSVPGRFRPRARQGRVEIRRASGYPIADLDELGEHLAQELGAGGAPGEHLVASFGLQYPSERRLDGTDQDWSRIRAVVRERESLVASGGVPGPAEPRYEIAAYGSANRPLRDALPSFLAARGEVTLSRPPLLSDIVVDSGSGSAVTTVTSSQDASGATKGVQVVAPATPVTATVRGQAQRLEFGNMTERFSPETQQAWITTTLAAAARQAESKLLADINGECDRFTDTPARYGAFRDLKRAVHGIAAEMRDRAREFDRRLVFAFPFFVPDMLVTDLVSQSPGDQAWSVTRDDVIAEMRTWAGGIIPVFMLDGLNGRLLTTPTTNGRSAGFDYDVDIWGWFDGAMLLLDGGGINLGIVRDSTLNGRNALQTFTETFETAMRVSSVKGVRLTISLCASGISQLAKDIDVCSPEGS
jgi:hypothetical protein